MKKRFLFLFPYVVAALLVGSAINIHGDEFVPRDGLLLWLAADSLMNYQNGSPVLRWRDQSAHGQDAEQDDPAAAPVFRAGRVNGLPALAFDGVRTQLQVPSLQIGYEYTVFIVSLDSEQVTGHSVHRALLGASNNPYRRDGDGYGFGYYTRDDLFGTSVVISDGTIWQHVRNWWRIQPTESFEVMASRKKDTWVTLKRNGILVSERDFDRPADADYAVGYDIGGITGRQHNFYVGEIAEILVYDRPLSDAAFRQVHDYLGEKYGIPIADEPQMTSSDPRFFDNGTLIFANGYNDQPYMTRLQDGSWLCVITTAAGEENDPDRHLVTFRSVDQGQTWVPAGDFIEPPEELRQPSWATLFTTPFGRVYTFYNLNPEAGVRRDYVYRFSDDNGQTWSEERYEMPLRRTGFDERFRIVQGWSVDQPIVVGDRVFVAYSKYHQSAQRHGEGWVFTSDNVLTETDPDKVRWEMWPAGDAGIRADALGYLQEEHNLVPLANGDLYAAFRTLAGYVGETYSRDGGHTWEEPVFATYADSERKIKHPRALARVWRTDNGHYLMWTHNHDGRDTPPRNKNRNPAWLLGGIEKDGRIHWSQPEVLFFGYVFKHDSGMSYPDLMEEDGRYWIAATDKVAARIHEIDSSLLQGLWQQADQARVPREGLVAEWRRDAEGHEISIEAAAPFHRGGLSVSLDVDWQDWPAGTVLLNAKTQSGAGFQLSVGPQRGLMLGLNDGRFGRDQAWETDAGMLVPGERHHVTFIVDAAPRLITVLVDGQLLDGGTQRQYGWTFYTPRLQQLPLPAVGQLHSGAMSAVRRVRIYDRPLRTSEAIAAERADRLSECMMQE
jgi:hypothetical protein